VLTTQKSDGKEILRWEERHGAVCAVAGTSRKPVIGPPNDSPREKTPGVEESSILEYLKRLRWVGSLQTSKASIFFPYAKEEMGKKNRQKSALRGLRLLPVRVHYREYLKDGNLKRKKLVGRIARKKGGKKMANNRGNIR